MLWDIHSKVWVHKIDWNGLVLLKVVRYNLADSLNRLHGVGDVPKYEVFSFLQSVTWVSTDSYQDLIDSSDLEFVRKMLGILPDHEFNELRVLRSDLAHCLEFNRICELLKIRKGVLAWIGVAIDSNKVLLTFKRLGGSRLARRRNIDKWELIMHEFDQSLC